MRTQSADNAVGVASICTGTWCGLGSKIGGSSGVDTKHSLVGGEQHKSQQRQPQKKRKDKSRQRAKADKTPRWVRPGVHAWQLRTSSSLVMRRKKNGMKKLTSNKSPQVTRQHALTTRKHTHTHTHKHQVQVDWGEIGNKET